MKKILGALIVCCVGSLAVFAQGTASARFNVRGTVKDWMGARVPLTQIMFSDERVNRELVSDDNGEFSADLPLGKYKLTAYRLSFCEETRPAFVLSSGDKIVFDLTLF